MNTEDVQRPMFEVLFVNVGGLFAMMASVGVMHYVLHLF